MQDTAYLQPLISLRRAFLSLKIAGSVCRSATEERETPKIDPLRLDRHGTTFLSAFLPRSQSVHLGARSNASNARTWYVSN